MPKTEGSDFERIAWQMNRAMDQLLARHFSNFSPTDKWKPTINAYQMQDRIDVCVDLAGVDRNSIDVRVEPGRLTIRGHRHAPQPPHEPGETMRILTMEIDHGAFERVFTLPRQVDSAGVTAEYAHGLLWVHMPFRGKR